jgi:hypothetical protein
VNRQIRLAILLLATILISSCSTDPYENSGKCETKGKSSIIDSRLAVCTGSIDNPKWYHSGKYYDDTVLLAKITYENYSDSDISESVFQREKVNTEELYDLYPKGLVSIEDLAQYAGNDSRWDSLIEAKADYDSASQQNSYLLQERSRLRNDWERGKATRQQAYLAQEEHFEFLNGEYSRAQADFDSKLEVLRATLSTQYGISDKSLLLILLIRHFESKEN